jgi:hypothetical protein
MGLIPNQYKPRIDTTVTEIGPAVVLHKNGSGVVSAVKKFI